MPKNSFMPNHRPNNPKHGMFGDKEKPLATPAEQVQHLVKCLEIHRKTSDETIQDLKETLSMALQRIKELESTSAQSALDRLRSKIDDWRSELRYAQYDIPEDEE